MTTVSENSTIRSEQRVIRNPALSAYEIQRAYNVETNNARLRQLGLLTAQEEQDSNTRAWKIQDETNPQSKKNKPSTTRKRKSQKDEESNLGRKSRRLQNLPPEHVAANDASLSSSTTFAADTEEKYQERQKHIKEYRAARQAAAFYKNSDTALKQAAHENPTATYEHCRMRVQTMTHAALRNRIKAIERAVGKHCVVKMAIFKSCLRDEGLSELADLATAALERLKALQPSSDEP